VGLHRSGMSVLARSLAGHRSIGAFSNMGAEGESQNFKCVSVGVRVSRRSGRRTGSNLNQMAFGPL
jgi:hypothetical protein